MLVIVLDTTQLSSSETEEESHLLRIFFSLLLLTGQDFTIAKIVAYGGGLPAVVATTAVGDVTTDKIEEDWMLHAKSAEIKT